MLEEVRLKPDLGRRTSDVGLGLSKLGDGLTEGSCANLDFSFVSTYPGVPPSSAFRLLERQGGRRRTCFTGRCGSMPYHVVALTMAQVRQGALAFQRELSAILRDASDVKVYSCSPFDLEERRRMKDRFGGDVVYFFNDAALRESMRLDLDLQFVAEISDNELPRRHSLVVGIPDQKVGS